MISMLFGAQVDPVFYPASFALFFLLYSCPVDQVAVSAFLLPVEPDIWLYFINICFFSESLQFLKHEVTIELSMEHIRREEEYLSVF